MPNVLKKIARTMFVDDSVAPLLKAPKKSRLARMVTERELIEAESAIGRTLFGPMPRHVVRRDFFNLDASTWIWHEVTRNDTGGMEEKTTRYEIQPRGILKIQAGPRYSYLEGAELRNFTLAVKAYYERVTTTIYKQISPGNE